MERYSDADIQKLVPVLRALFKLVAKGQEHPDRDTVRRTLAEACVPEEEWVFTALNTIYGIVTRGLETGGSGKADSVRELEALGFSYAQAFLLLVESAGTGPRAPLAKLSSEPPVRQDEPHSDEPIPAGRYSKEQIRKLVPLLAIVARLVREERKTLDRPSMNRALREVGVQEENWMADALRTIHGILTRSRHSAERESHGIARELENMGFPPAQVVSAVERARQGRGRSPDHSPSPVGRDSTAVQRTGGIQGALSVSPRAINFGLLPTGKAVEASLDVGGEVVRAISPDSRLVVTVSQQHNGHSVVRISLRPGGDGETLSASVVLVGHHGQLLVPVAAGWRRIKGSRHTSADMPPLQFCPNCGHRSVFWNQHAHRYECLNVNCKREGPTLKDLRR